MDIHATAARMMTDSECNHEIIRTWELTELSISLKLDFHWRSSESIQYILDMASGTYGHKRLEVVELALDREKKRLSSALLE